MVETVKQLSINDVVGGGIKLSLLLNAVSCEVTSPGVEIHNIAKTVSLFALTLKQIGRGFQARDSLHTGDALSIARKIAVQGRVVFDEFEQMLDKARGTGGYSVSPDSTVNQRYSQSFKPHRVTYLLAHMESLQLSLTVMSLVFQIGRSTAAQRHGDKYHKPPTNDMIQQEQLDAQNMVVVRHCSVDRLNTLYGFSKREAYLSHNDEIRTSDGRPENPTLSTPPNQLPVIPLGDTQNPSSSMNGSPRDMVRESANVVDRLVTLWIRQDFDRKKPSVTNETRGSDGNIDRTSEPNLQGHYAGGSPYDRKAPHPSSPRTNNPRQQGRYSEYQSRVETDSDSSDSSGDLSRHRKSGDRKVSFDTTDDESGTDGLRRHAREKSNVQKKTRFEEPRSRTHPYSQGSKASRSDWHVNSSTAPQFHSNPSRRPIPSSHQHGAYHPAPFSPHYQQQHYPPPRHHETPERRPSSRHRRRDSSSSRDDRSRHTSDYDERCRRLKKNATKGILGIGALAGFLTALEKL